jgi:RNA polymerase subunit RPABC4/transcription elongation factor Spt4
MGIEGILARGAQLLLALGGAYLIALWFVLVVWTYRDIESRSKNVITQIFSTLLVVLFWIPGVLLYMILRPKETLDSSFQRSLEEEYLLQDLEELPLCPSCERYVHDDFVLCPHCHTKLRDNCHACGRLVDLTWSVCPYCAADQGKEAVAASITKVSEPEPRYLAPKKPPASTELPTGIRPSATAIGPAPRRLITPGERPSLPPAQRTVAESPVPFTIVAGTPPRPATGRFRPQVRSANGRSDQNGREPDKRETAGSATNGRADKSPSNGTTAPVVDLPKKAETSTAASGDGDKPSDESER